jgi:formate C-acetyltransferase
MSRNKNWQIISFLRSEALLSPELAASPTPIREARILAHILENLPLFYVDGESIAGDFGWRQEDENKLARFFAPSEKSTAGNSTSAPTPEEELRRDFHCFGGFTSAHTCIDYEKLLNVGVSGLIDEISERRDSAEGQEGIYLTAMDIAMNALLKYAGRFTGMLEKTAAEGKDGNRAISGNLSGICKRMPGMPAANFHDALQSIWFVHSLIGISEYNDASISLGRFDQYLYPCYRKSMDAGCSEGALEKILTDFLIKLNRYGDAACSVNLGGIGKHGEDLCNPLTAMIIRVVSANNFASPILAARIYPGFPQNVFDQLTVPELFIKGQPTFYGEIPCRKALRKRGVPAAKLEKWAANSCMGLVIQGAEISDMWGSVVNFLLPLELALNNGCPFAKSLPIKLHTQSCDKFEDFKTLMCKFLEHVKELTGYCISNNRLHTEKALQDCPNPFLSSFLDKCIERGKDRLGGGVEFYTVIVEAFGLINAADALFAIDTLAFKEKKYPLADLICAAKNNFDAHETLLKDIRNVPKYGNGNLAADRFASVLADHFHEIVNSFSDGKVVYAPSFHTLNVHVPAGKKYGASLDGRLTGEPLAKNIGTTPGMALNGHTSLIRSAATIDQSKYFGGQALDLSIDASLMNDLDSKRKFQALIRTYFELGGLQIQVNGLNAETLKAAMEEPDKYRDLIVRIAGYSVYFDHLGIDTQREMVKRFSHGM